MANGGFATTLLLIAILIGAVIGVVYLLIASKGGRTLNKERYQTQWLEIENSVLKDNLATWQLAIINADKLVDQALKDKRFSGQTMGDRMKSAKTVWTNPDYIWGAHKIRNKLAHDVNVQINYDITKKSLIAFKQALKDLGAI